MRSGWAFWVLGAVLIVVLAFEGHRLSHVLPEAEAAIQRLGVWGPVIFFAAVLVLEPFLFPNTPFGMAAGVVFGLWEGYAIYFLSVYLANLVVYGIGRRLLREPVLHALESRGNIREAVAAAKKQGTSLVFWIRLLPLNPSIFSYAFGAVETPFRAVAIGTFGMFPHMFLDVYFGTVAAHVTKMAGEGHGNWEVKGIGLLLGLVAIAVLSWRIARIAQAQIEAAGISHAP